MLVSLTEGRLVLQMQLAQTQSTDIRSHTKCREWKKLRCWNESTVFTHCLEKLVVAQPVQKFFAFYGAQRLVSVLRRDCCWSLLWARWIPSMPSTHASSSYMFSFHCEVSRVKIHGLVAQKRRSDACLSNINRIRTGSKIRSKIILKSLLNSVSFSSYLWL
jgi:hypothetical protein